VSPTGPGLAGTGDPNTPALPGFGLIQQSTLLGQFDLFHPAFLGGSGMPPGAPWNAPSVDLKFAGGQLTTDLTAIGTFAGMSRGSPGDPTSGGTSQTPQVTGVGMVLGQLDSAGKPDLTNLPPPDTKVVPR
jgi:hypothetical protein